LVTNFIQGTLDDDNKRNQPQERETNTSIESTVYQHQDSKIGLELIATEACNGFSQLDFEGLGRKGHDIVAVPLARMRVPSLTVSRELVAQPAVAFVNQLVTKNKTEITVENGKMEQNHQRETNTSMETDKKDSKIGLELIGDGAMSQDFDYDHADKLKALSNGFTEKYEDVKTAHIRSICELLGRHYKRMYKKETVGFNFYEFRKTNKYICLMSRNLLMRVSEERFRMYANKYMNHSTLKVKYIEHEGDRIMIVTEKVLSFRPQIGFIQRCLDTLKTPFVMLEGARDLINRVTSRAAKMLLIDIISMLLHLKDGYFTATKVVGVIMQLYTIHSRYMELFSPNNYRPQSGPTITELLLGFSLMGLPVDILNAIKTFSTLTGKRIFESETFLELADKMFESLLVIVRWIAEPFTGYRLMTVEIETSIIEILNKLGSSIFIHRDIKTVCDIYTKYVSNPQVLFDPTFRQEIMNKYNALKSNAAFMSYVQNVSNKYFVTTWNLFEANVVKSCQAFDTSGRDEPVCFVFEGEAGSGKSCLMNMFVALLKEAGMTTICHSVPAAEDGKDFYDDYENQDVFVMDDVGQQGKSQWRYLINYVSPVKYPLPCATASKKNTKFF